MNKYRVYSKDGRVVRCETSALEYNGEWLGACSVTLSVSSATPIDFEIGDYVEYRGERFTINYDPTELKQASKDSYGEAFKYENIVFNSYSDELTRCMFLDYVKSDNMVHYSSLPVFSFYAEDITYLAERIQVNLDRIYTGDDKWVVEVHPEYVNVTNRNISVSSVNVWDALALVKSEFDANFIIRGRKIIIGTEGIAVDKLFSYGKGNGLYSIQKTAESDQAIVTRLRAYGSVKNMPMSYYKDVTTKCFFPEHEVSAISDSRLTLATTVDITKCFTARWEGEANNVYRVKVQIGSVTAVAKAYVFDNPKVTLDVNTDTGNTSAAVKAIVDAYRANSERVELVSGVDKSKYPLAYVESSPMPNNMAINNLMLPSFPNESLDPYIDSANIDELGIREGTIFFDGSGDLEEIYPTLEGMTAEALKAAGVPTVSSGALDEVVMAEQVADDGTPNGSNEARQATFTITIKDIGFDINDYASDNAVIAMTTGMCGGREFAIEKCERVSGGYQLTCSRVKDETLGLYFPYNYYNIAAGDKFVLLNIDMPDVYVKAASERLLMAATEWLSKNDYTRYVYEPKVDEIFMARQHAEALATGGVSIHDTIKEGDLMLFEDADLGVNGSIIINSLTIKEDGSDVPTYEVVLRADKAVGTIQKIQNQIDSIVKHGVSGGGGYNSQQIQQFIKSFGDKYFLRKDAPDSTNYLQKFLGGVEVGEFLKGSNGIGMYQDSTGNWHIETDYLDVRFKFSATEVEIQKTSHIGGKVINTAASMMVANVIETSNGYICYMNTTDDAGNTIYNTFEVGDQAYCETFNLDKQANGKVGNHFFWRLVTEVGTNYIILSKSDCAEQSDAPLSGDEIVLLGNRTNADRQGAIVQASAGSGSPYIRIYDKIKSYTLPKPKINLSPEGTEISADSIVLQSTGNNMEDEVGDLINITNTLSRELDGSFYVWQGEDNTIPTLENEPAVNWITDGIKQEHVDDFYITTDGFCYQFAYDEATNTYSWKIVTDQYLIKFVEQIGEKRRVFVDMPTDNDVYDVGDTWVNATYKDEELGVDYSNDVLVCIQAKDKGEAFNIVHWRKNSKYTDDTVANLVKQELDAFSEDYEQTIPLLQLQIDSKAETWYQDSDPKGSEGWGEDAKHVGDLWYKESTGETFYFDGTKWNKQNIPVAVFDKFDAKASIYVAKPSKYKANDMWILESNYTLSGTQYNKGTIVFAKQSSSEFNASHWEKRDKYTDDSALNNFINNDYSVNIRNLNNQIDKKAETWYQDVDPRTSSNWGSDQERIGDMWCTTAGKTQIWNGTEWMQQGIPDEVFDTIDGKSSIYIAQPSQYQERDMWILEKDYVLDKAYKAGTFVVAIRDMEAVFNGNDWTKLDSYSDAEEVESIKDDLQSLANKVNSEFAGSFYIWQGDDNTVPTLNNKPAVDWTDDNMRQAHVDDFYISADGVVYQFRLNGSKFGWVKVDDKYVIAYIEQMRSQLLATGIDINGREIIATANKFTVRSDVDGTPIAVFGVEVVDGVGIPYIKGDLLRVNHVNIADGSILLNKDGSGQLAGGNISWDAEGNVVTNGATRTKWKTLTYGVIYRSGNVDIWGFNGSAISDDRIMLESMAGAELLLAWGENANGREIEIFNKVGMRGADAKIIVPAGCKIIVSATEMYGEGSEYMLKAGHIYYMTGMSDAWIVRQVLKIQAV